MKLTRGNKNEMPKLKGNSLPDKKRKRPTILALALIFIAIAIMSALTPQNSTNNPSKENDPNYNKPTINGSEQESLLETDPWEDFEGTGDFDPEAFEGEEDWRDLDATLEENNDREKVRTLPWYAVSSLDINKDVKQEDKKSEAANQSYDKIIQKINNDYIKKENENNINQEPRESMDNGTQNIIDSVNQAGRDAIENNLYQPPNNSSNDISVSQSKELQSLKLAYENLLENYNTLKKENAKLESEVASPTSTDKEGITSPSTNEIGKDTEGKENNDGSGSETLKPNTLKDVVVSSLSEFDNKERLPIVKHQSSNQYAPMDELAKKFYVITPPGETALDYLNDMIYAYKGQLLVDNIDYKLAEGYKNVYELTTTYLIDTVEKSEIEKTAKEFYQSHSNLTDEQYVLQVALHISNKAEYGDSSNKYSPYALLKGEKVVCQAYTSYAQFLLSQKGIYNYLATGKVKGEEHVWNVIKVGGEEFHYDFTMFDTSNNNNKYLKSALHSLSDRTFESYIK